MKEYIALWHPTSHALLLDEVNKYAEQGWRLFSFHDSNRLENFTAIMERDSPEPPASAHLTKEDYETLNKAAEWLNFLLIGTELSDRNDSRRERLLNTETSLRHLAERAGKL